MSFQEQVNSFGKNNGRGYVFRQGAQQTMYTPVPKPKQEPLPEPEPYIPTSEDKLIGRLGPTLYMDNQRIKQARIARGDPTPRKDDVQEEIDELLNQYRESKKKSKNEQEEMSILWSNNIDPNLDEKPEEIDRLIRLYNENKMSDKVSVYLDDQPYNENKMSGKGMCGGLQDVNRMHREAEEEGKREAEEVQTTPIDYMRWASSSDGVENIRGYLTTGPGTQGERNLEFFRLLEENLINLNDPASAVEYLHSVLEGVGFSGSNINRILNEGMPRMRNVFNNLYRR